MKYILIIMFLYMITPTKAQDTTFYLVESVEVKLLQGENLNTFYNANLSDKRKEYIYYTGDVLYIDKEAYSIGKHEPKNISSSVSRNKNSCILDLMVDENGGVLTIMDELGNVVEYLITGILTN